MTRQLPPQLDAYLARIGAARPPRVDAAALRELQLRHLLTVPFENLSIHLGEPIVLDPQALVDKVVRRRRGGFCYELNGAFATLLAALGFRVTLLAARVFGAHGLGPPFDHLTLRIDLDSSGSWLVDVGFGRHSHYPLRLDTRTDQVDPGGTFRLADSDDGDLDVIRDGQPQYRVEARPRTLADFEPTCWWHQTSPRSHFTHGPVCSRLTETGRVTLSDRTLVQTTGDRHQEHTLTDDAEILAAYRTWFGIVLQRVPGQPAATPATALPPARPGQTAPTSAGLHIGDQHPEEADKGRCSPGRRRDGPVAAGPSQQNAAPEQPQPGPLAGGQDYHMTDAIKPPATTAPTRGPERTDPER